jgi:hypothetical protein
VSNVNLRDSGNMTKQPAKPDHCPPPGDTAAERAARWQRENAAAIRSSIAYFEANGLPLARFRQF